MEGTRVLIKVITDYKSLKYFITTKKLTSCQACWVKFLSSFSFIIFYILSKKNQKADFLTYYSNNPPLSKNDNCQRYQL